MFARRKTVYAWLIGVGIVFFALAWVPNDSSLSWLATIGWLGMMLSILGIVIFSVALGMRRLRGRSGTKSVD